MAYRGHLTRFIVCVLWTAHAVGAVALTNGGEWNLQGNVPADQIIALAQPNRTTAAGYDGALFLRNGERIIGVPVASTATDITFQSDRLGQTTMPLAAIAEIHFGPLPAQMLAIDFVGAQFVNGDALPGTLVFSDERNIGLDSGRRVMTIPRERVARVVLGPATTSSDGWTFILRSGDYVQGKLGGSPSGWTATLDKKALPFAEHVCCGWRTGKDMLPLSQRNVAGLTSAIAVNQFHDGRGLQVGSTSVGYGFAVRGAATLTTKAQSWKRLVGVVDVSEGTDVRVAISVDQKEIWSGTPQVHHDPIPFSVDLAGGTSVTISISVPDAAGSPLVVVGWPTLVR